MHCREGVRSPNFASFFSSNFSDFLLLFPTKILIIPMGASVLEVDGNALQGGSD